MLPATESTWCQYLGASTTAVSPLTHGDVRVTLISSEKVSRVMYRMTVLIELWADPATSEADAIALHDKVVKIDSKAGLLAYITNVDADAPAPNDDPDSGLDRYQFLVTHVIRTI